MINDTLADALTRIRNGQMAKHSSVKVGVTKLTRAVLDVIQKEGFINSVELKKPADGFPYFEVGLKYQENGDAVLERISRVSKPGCRVYRKVNDLKKLRGGLAVAILTTPKGVMSDREARKQKIGGEVLAIIG